MTISYIDVSSSLSPQVRNNFIDFLLHINEINSNKEIPVNLNLHHQPCLGFNRGQHVHYFERCSDLSFDYDEVCTPNTVPRVHNYEFFKSDHLYCATPLGLDALCAIGGPHNYD